MKSIFIKDKTQNALMASGLEDNDRLPSLNGDFNDLLATNELDQLLQGFEEDTTMNVEDPLNILNASHAEFHETSCDISSFFMENTFRPKDLNLSMPDEENVPAPLFNTPKPSNPESLYSHMSTLDKLSHASTSSQVLEVSISPQVPSTSSHTPSPFLDIKTEARQSPTSPLSNSQNSSLLLIDNRSPTSPNSVYRAPSPCCESDCGSNCGNNSSTSVFGPSHSREQRTPRCSNPVPRHKRPSHKRAEIKRRDKIKTNLDDLKEFVPSLKDKGKLSESTILTKAAAYIHHLKDGCDERGKQAEDLRREIENLSSEIHSFQDHLPEAGIEENEASMDTLFKQWSEERSKHDTKFLIFSSLIFSLFESFKSAMASVSSLSSLTTASQDWQTNSLSLPSLRKTCTDFLEKFQRWREKKLLTEVNRL